MLIKVDISAVRETRWYQYVIRFGLGGAVTALAGLIAKQYGPSIGGLFLAFPAIFPASATLIERHERQRKEEKGLNGLNRAREAVSADAAGAAIGSIGLIAFGWCAWKILSSNLAWQAIAAATAVWLIVSVALWYARKRHLLRRLLHPLHAIGMSSQTGPAQTPKARG